MDITYIAAILLLMVLFSLPDMLRRRRRYKTKPRPKVPTRTMPKRPSNQPVEAGRQEDSANRTDEGISEAQKVWLQALEQDDGPSHTKFPSPSAVQKEDEPREGWSQLDGMARDIYAGIVWSELLQKPKSLRRRQ